MSESVSAKKARAAIISEVQSLVEAAKASNGGRVPRGFMTGTLQAYESTAPWLTRHIINGKSYQNNQKRKKESQIEIETSAVTNAAAPMQQTATPSLPSSIQGTSTTVSPIGLDAMSAMENVATAFEESEMTVTSEPTRPDTVSPTSLEDNSFSAPAETSDHSNRLHELASASMLLGGSTALAAMDTLAHFPALSLALAQDAVNKTK